MKLKILEKGETKLKFILEGASPAFANALRRIMINEVPTMAVEFVDFEVNMSGLFDEVLAHRAGLVPLTFSRDVYNMKSECKCKGKGCSQCEVVLVVDKKGPCVVKAGDMKSSADDVMPADAEIPLVELLEGQAVKFDATAQLGLGKQHTKWQASITGYRNAPIVKVNAEKADTKIVDICPTRVFEKKDGKVKVAREEDCILCMRCTEVSDGVNIGSDDTSFIFTVESVCGLPATDIVGSALDVLEARASEFAGDVKKALK
ncbi:MAG: DNA-directed RNA polymerase subunit D [Candidatus Aenigmarchaeota archaeon]|nr:DNA-directed RNA polymerase subunit D [Candidatus Aenigmarchaeota archaeon]